MKDTVTCNGRKYECLQSVHDGLHVGYRSDHDFSRGPAPLVLVSGSLELATLDIPLQDSAPEDPGDAKPESPKLKVHDPAAVPGGIPSNDLQEPAKPAANPPAVDAA